MKKPEIPYSHIYESLLEDQVYYVNEMLKENIHRFPEIKSIELNGLADGSLDTVEFHVKFRDGSNHNFTSKRHIDEGAIRIHESELEAYWGLSKSDSEQALKYVHKHGLKSLDEGIYNQLCANYIYSCLPHSNGGEFLEQDYEFFREMINELKAA